MIVEFTSGDYVRALKVLDLQNYLAVCDNKIYASSDSGANWALRGTVVGASQIMTLESMGGGVLLANDFDTGTLWRSTDTGATWALVKNPNCYESVARILKHLGNGIILAGFDHNGLLFRSIDYGLTWDSGTVLDGHTSYGGLIEYEGKLYLAAGNSIYVSVDSGVTWTLSMKLANMSDIIIFFKNSNGIFVTIDKNKTIFWGYPIEA